jgi:uncharacterized protein YheU (UPF0270 family)
MLIPHRQLSHAALQELIEEFVTRDGTDYGEREISLATKVAQVKRQLDQGLLVIVYSEQDGSVTIANKDQLPLGLDSTGGG